MFSTKLNFVLIKKNNVWIIEQKKPHLKFHVATVYAKQKKRKVVKYQKRIFFLYDVNIKGYKFFFPIFPLFLSGMKNLKNWIIYNGCLEFWKVFALYSFCIVGHWLIVKQSDWFLTRTMDEQLKKVNFRDNRKTKVLRDVIFSEKYDLAILCLVRNTFEFDQWWRKYKCKTKSIKKLEKKFSKWTLCCKWKEN